ncbi:hypothetical protein Agub_g14741, partial [Astrephomene gubernaculifera]
HYIALTAQDKLVCYAIRNTTVNPAQFPASPPKAMTEAQDVDSEEFCYICFEGPTRKPDGELEPLVQVCKCPTRVHRKCVARWQLYSAGKQEEKSCRFCKGTLPDWKEVLTPSALPPAIPVLSIYYNNTCCRMKVRPGPDGLQVFLRQLEAIVGRDVANVNFVFRCRCPDTGAEIFLQGLQAFEAAMHCACVRAAQRSLQQQRQQQLLLMQREQQQRLLLLQQQQQRPIRSAFHSPQAPIHGSSISHSSMLNTEQLLQHQQQQQRLSRQQQQQPLSQQPAELATQPQQQPLQASAELRPRTPPPPPQQQQQLVLGPGASLASLAAHHHQERQQQQQPPQQQPLNSHQPTFQMLQGPPRRSYERAVPVAAAAAVANRAIGSSNGMALGAGRVGGAANTAPVTPLAPVHAARVQPMCPLPSAPCEPRVSSPGSRRVLPYPPPLPPQSPQQQQQQPAQRQAGGAVLQTQGPHAAWTASAAPASRISNNGNGIAALSASSSNLSPRAALRQSHSLGRGTQQLLTQQQQQQQQQQLYGSSSSSSRRSVVVPLPPSSAPQAGNGGGGGLVASPSGTAAAAAAAAAAAQFNRLAATPVAVPVSALAGNLDAVAASELSSSYDGSSDAAAAAAPGPHGGLMLTSCAELGTSSSAGSSADEAVTPPPPPPPQQPIVVLERRAAAVSAFVAARPSRRSGTEAGAAVPSSTAGDRKAGSGAVRDLHGDYDNDSVIVGSGGCSGGSSRAKGSGKIATVLTSSFKSLRGLFEKYVGRKGSSRVA